MKKVLSVFLKAGVVLVARMSAGKLFQAAASATLNARSPNFSDVGALVGRAGRSRRLTADLRVSWTVH